MTTSSGPRIIGTNVVIDDSASVDDTCTIGHCTIIGYHDDLASTETPAGTVIGPHCTIGCHCVVERGAQLGKRVSVDHYVRVGPRSVIGADTRLLYGCRVHEDVTIGRNCRISGNCPDRTVIGDEVTHFGRLHHAYRTPWSGWDETVEISMSIGSRTVIGAGAVLVGEIEIGSQVYVAAGEVVRKPIPDRSVCYRGEIIPAADWRGKLSESGFFDEPTNFGS